MLAITIWDTKKTDGFSLLAFDLKDILIEVEDLLPGSLWRLENDVDATGQAVEDLNAWFSSGKPLSGMALLTLSKGIDQTFEGQFIGEKDGQLWLLIESIRGVEFLVATPESEVISRLRRRFQDVRDSPKDADWYNNLPPS